jgi:hypothetical protein
MRMLWDFIDRYFWNIVIKTFKFSNSRMRIQFDGITPSIINNIFLLIALFLPKEKTSEVLLNKRISMRSPPLEFFLK